ncbi:MAG: hypothetical protein KDA96_07405 [Planctomycetaceae bacterium]|nr:hypothetical protein [Planctomycetaceae bacterium]
MAQAASQPAQQSPSLVIVHTTQPGEVARRSMAPGMIVSVTLHVLVLILASMTFRGCQKGTPGAPGGEVFREVGLFAVPGTDPRPQSDGSADSESQQDSDGSDAVTQNPTATAPSDLLPEEAPSLEELLGKTTTNSSQSTSPLDIPLPSVIGPGSVGSGLPRQPSPSGSSSVAGSSGGESAAGTTIGAGQTAFMNIVDGGSRFVYLIDASSSMGLGHRLELAKTQLKASLRMLQPNQSFHVIFYNLKSDPLILRNEPEVTMHRATEQNVRNACAAIDSRTADEGTEHKPALVKALSNEPDVLYFLTDGDQPQLYASDMKEIVSYARGTTIHVIEFADEGLRRRGPNWLQELAQKTGGEYRRYVIPQ